MQQHTAGVTWGTWRLLMLPTATSHANTHTPTHIPFPANGSQNTAHIHTLCVGAPTDPPRTTWLNCQRTCTHAHCVLALTLMQQHCSSSLATCTLLPPPAVAEQSTEMTGMSAPIQAGRPSLALLLLSLLLSGVDSIRNRSPPSGSIANHSLLQQRQQRSTAQHSGGNQCTVWTAELLLSHESAGVHACTAKHTSAPPISSSCS